MTPETGRRLIVQNSETSLTPGSVAHAVENFATRKKGGIEQVEAQLSLCVTEGQKAFVFKSALVALYDAKVGEQINQPTFNKKVRSLMQLDDSISDETEKRDFDTVSRVLRGMIDSEDPDEEEKGIRLCATISSAAMRDLGMIDSDVCGPRRIYSYIQVLAGTMSERYFRNAEMEIKEEEIIEQLLEAVIERDDEEPGFASEVVGHLLEEENTYTIKTLKLLAVRNRSDVVIQFLQNVYYSFDVEGGHPFYDREDLEDQD